MEARVVGIGAGFENIVPFENIPVDQLPEHANDLANQHPKAVEQLQAIKYLYELAVNENADLHNALNKNVQGDVQFAKGFEGVLEATTKENALLKMEIIHLKNQKVESDKAAEEKVKSAQELIRQLEREIVSQKEMIVIQGKAIDTFDRVTQEIANIRSDFGYFNPMMRLCSLNFLKLRCDILKNQVEETRQQQMELLKSQCEDKAINQNINL